MGRLLYKETRNVAVQPKAAVTEKCEEIYFSIDIAVSMHNNKNMFAK